MDNNSTQNITDRQLLEEIHTNTRKTKNYIKWQLIITVALVVIPLLITIIAIPLALNSLGSIGSIYTGTEGLLQ